MAEIKVEKPAASTKLSKEELRARLSRNPNFNPETGMPASATAPSTASVTTGSSNAPVDGRAAAGFSSGKVPSVNAPSVAAPKTPSDFVTAVNSAFPDMTKGGPIDASRSPITGLPSPKLGESPARPFLNAANQPMPDMTKGGPIDASRSPITGLPSPKLGESPARPFLNAANQPLPDMTKGGPIDASRSPITGLPSPKLGVGPSPEELFKVVHGKGGFNPKSKMDQAKMKDIMSLMATPEGSSLSPKQFAMQIYKNQKPRK